MRDLEAHVREQRIETVKQILPFYFICLQIILGCLIYVPAFDAPMVFDSVRFIEKSPEAQDFWSGEWFFSGRRWLAVMTFALDREIHGQNNWGYHFTNFSIHTLNSWLLFSVSNRILRLSRDRFLEESSSKISFAAATIWFVHPLQTQAVIYTVQRMESMMMLFGMLCIHFFLLGWEKKEKWYWSLSLLCVFAAAACKESAVAIPFIVAALGFMLHRDFDGSNAVKSRAWLAVYFVFLFSVLFFICGATQ